MDRRPHHGADASPRRDPRADVAGGARDAAAAAPAGAAARAALPHGAARVLRRLADPVPPSIARLARVLAAERRAQAHGGAFCHPGIAMGAHAPARGALTRRRRAPMEALLGIAELADLDEPGEHAEHRGDAEEESPEPAVAERELALHG